MAFATPLISGGSASAALVFYESFEGFSTGGWPAGSTYGEWTVNVPGVGVAAKGLSYSNGDVWVHGGANALQFASGANDNAGAALVTNFGSQTGTLYFSFFAEANPVVHGGQGPWLQPILSPNDTGDSDHACVIVNAGPATYFGGLGGETAARIRGTAATTELLDHYAAGSTVFVVGKLWKSNPGGNYDRLSAAVNPTTLTEPASWTATVSHDLGAGSVEHLRFRTDQFSGGELAWIDEIRVGTSYEDAIGMADGVWTGTQHGNWSDRTNWQNGLPARGSHRTATFSIDLPEGERFVSVDNGRVIGNLVFGDTDPSSAGSWALLSGTLTLETTSPEVPTITVHPLGPGAAVRITAILAGHQGLIKAGEGRLILTPRENDYGPTTDVQGGTLQIGNNEHSVFVGTAGHQYTIAAGAELVFSRNRYAADFTSQSIGGAGDVIFRGQESGIFRFGAGYSGSLTYTGKTVIDLDVGETWDTGTLWLEKDDVLPHATVVEMRSGKIYLRNQTGSGLTIAGLEGGAETFLVPRHGAGVQQLTLDVAEGSTYVYAGTIGSDGAMGPDGIPRGGDNLALTKTGPGTQVLTGTHTYTGGTTVAGGTLQIGNGAGSYLGPTGHQYTVESGAQLVFHRNHFATDFTAQSIGGEGDVIFRGQESGIFRFQNYAGTLTYTGKTVIDLDMGETWDTGTLWLEKDDVLPHATVVEMRSGKIYLRNQTGSGLTIAGLEGGAETFLVPRHGAGVQQLTLDVAEGSTYVYAGTIGSDGAMGPDGIPRGGDNLALTKTGLGTQVLAGNSTYAGGTLVSGGMLQVTGSLAAGEAVRVHDGGTLAGTGTIHSTVSILTGGTLAPGRSADGLDLGGDLAFEADAFFDVEIDSLGGASRVQMAGGTLSPGNATIRVTLLDDFDPEPYSSWTILSGEGDREGGFMPTVLVDGPKFRAAGKWLEVSYLNSVVLTVAVPVPEPATLVMAAAGLAMLLLRRRR